MRLSLFFVATTTLSCVHASSNMLTPYGAINKRQAFNPDETTGTGNTCVEAFGPGYVECVPASATKPRLCINPELGEKCCDEKWGCPGKSFCLVQDLCCPDGLDAKTCAAQNDVTLPPDFTTPAGSGPTGAGAGSRPTPKPSVKPSSYSDDDTPTSATASRGFGGGYGKGNGTRTAKPPIQTAGAGQHRGVDVAAAMLGLAAAAALVL